MAIDPSLVEVNKVPQDNLVEGRAVKITRVLMKE